MSKFEDSYYKAMIAVMNFEQASIMADKLNEDATAKGKVLEAFPRNPIGLVSDSIRLSPEYVTANKAYGEAFARLRSFNGFFTKQFKKELAEARARRRRQVAS
jgi:hypothetical protein